MSCIAFVKILSRRVLRSFSLESETPISFNSAKLRSCLRIRDSRCSRSLRSFTLARVCPRIKFQRRLDKLFTETHARISLVWIGTTFNSPESMRIIPDGGFSGIFAVHSPYILSSRIMSSTVFVQIFWISSMD